MGIFNSLYDIASFIGVIFIAAGIFMYIFPPKKINSFYGYRTKQSMSSQEKWDFSQKFSAKLMMKSGGILFSIGLISLFLNVGETTSRHIVIGSLLTVTIHLIYTTEKKLKQKFKENEALQRDTEI